MAKTKSHFTAKVQQALGLAVQEPARFNDARDEKLSAKSYLQEALKNARMNQDKIRALDEQLGGLDRADFPYMANFMSGVHRVVTATRIDRGCALRPPKGNLHLLCGEGWEARNAGHAGVIAETMQFGTNPFELIALVVYRAVRDEPDVFGVIDDWGAHERAVTEREQQLEALCSEIESGWTLEDVLVEEPPKGSERVRVTFKMAPSVSVFPRQGAGRRLVEALRAG